MILSLGGGHRGAGARSGSAQRTGAVAGSGSAAEWLIAGVGASSAVHRARVRGGGQRASPPRRAAQRALTQRPPRSATLAPASPPPPSPALPVLGALTSRTRRPVTPQSNGALSGSASRVPWMGASSFSTALVGIYSLKAMYLRCCLVVARPGAPAAAPQRGSALVWVRFSREV
ncbi:unnamed protein product [Euphydryas editha]|uniref:Uncharacterized protein n=1 Tax=Euphydryas editha TaxID=104508 RepID=A0AAU9UJK9_EUPED|nr:unnamed protein product [Euphydryas editha]